MDEKIFNELLSNLNWNLPLEVQEGAIKSITEVIDEQKAKILVQFGSKALWENEARILKNIGYPKNKYTIPGLLEWLQDLNWPGALISMEALIAIEDEILAPYVENAIINAAGDNDVTWKDSLKELLSKKESLKTKIKKDINKLLME
jgi:HEAT repeat protein